MVVSIVAMVLAVIIYAACAYAMYKHFSDRIEKRNK